MLDEWEESTRASSFFREGIDSSLERWEEENGRWFFKKKWWDIEIRKENQKPIKGGQSQWRRNEKILCKK